MEGCKENKRDILNEEILMKKERLLYLDFVRALAAISIILTHYNARYILFANPPVMQNVILTGTVSNIYIGDWGVSLFFIISGAALMYTYDEKCSLKYYLKKRFLSIYPMFWLAYSIVFLYYFYIYKRVPFDVPKRNFAFTLIGFDGYISEIVPTFYILGEWFLGAIIIFYLLFPLIRVSIKKYPIISGIVIINIYILTVWKYNLPFTECKFIFTRLPEFAFGMYFVKYIKKVNLKMFFLSCIILIINGICKPEFNTNIQTTYVGILSFITLVYISKIMRYNWIKVPMENISKYSYAIFLTHHVIIAQIMGKYDYANISIIYSWILFILCCALIGLATIALYSMHRRMMGFITKCIEKE